MEHETPTGLMNMGNTCYLNTLLQCILHSNCLREYILKSRKDTEQTPLLTEFGILFHQMWELKQSLVPKRFLTILNRLSPDYLSFGYQQDINESWCWIMDQLQKEHTNIHVSDTLHHLQSLWTLEYMHLHFNIQKDPSENWEFHRQCLQAWSGFHKNCLGHFDWIQKHEGLLVNQVCCNQCGKLYHNYEPFSSLTLEIPIDKSNPNPKESCHLSECFQSYLKTEILNQTQHDWKCDDCKEYTSAEKIVRFWKVPECLVILLKRFMHSDSNGQCKITTGIDIPFEFEFLKGTELLPLPYKKYQLKAIGNHYGNIHGGHYNASCLHKGQWWNIDDLHMQPIHEQREDWSKGNTSCYMLFYERCCE
jgi:ubiquitin carboxyl-terminal hydrolase 8